MDSGLGSVKMETCIWIENRSYKVKYRLEMLWLQDIEQKQENKCQDLRDLVYRYSGE